MNKDLKLAIELLYKYRNKTDLSKDLNRMLDQGWLVEQSIYALAVYKEDIRMHCGNVLIVDTLVSTKKGEGSALIKTLKQKYPNHTMQLDCRVNNSAINFYEKLGFIKRAWSLISK